MSSELRSGTSLNQSQCFHDRSGCIVPKGLFLEYVFRRCLKFRILQKTVAKWLSTIKLSICNKLFSVPFGFFGLSKFIARIHFLVDGPSMLLFAVNNHLQALNSSPTPVLTSACFPFSFFKRFFAFFY